MKTARDEQNIIGWLSAANQVVQTYLDKKYEHLGINGYQHAYITIVCRNPGIPQKELVDFFNIDPSNVTRNIVFLEKAGYLKRQKDEKDKRAWRLYPTEKAEENYDEIVRIFDGWKTEIMGDFTKEEQEQFSSYLNRITQRTMEFNNNK